MHIKKTQLKQQMSNYEFKIHIVLDNKPLMMFMSLVTRMSCFLRLLLSLSKFWTCYTCSSSGGMKVFQSAISVFCELNKYVF